MRTYHYERVEADSEEQFIGIVNLFGEQGYRLYKWYENKELGIFTGVLEKSMDSGLGEDRRYRQMTRQT